MKYKKNDENQVRDLSGKEIVNVFYSVEVLLLLLTKVPTRPPDQHLTGREQKSLKTKDIYDARDQIGQKYGF